MVVGTAGTEWPRCILRLTSTRVLIGDRPILPDGRSLTSKSLVSLQSQFWAMGHTEPVLGAEGPAEFWIFEPPQTQIMRCLDAVSLKELNLAWVQGQGLRNYAQITVNSNVHMFAVLQRLADHVTPKSAPRHTWFNVMKTARVRCVRFLAERKLPERPGRRETLSS